MAALPPAGRVALFWWFLLLSFSSTNPRASLKNVSLFCCFVAASEGNSKDGSPPQSGGGDGGKDGGDSGDEHESSSASGDVHKPPDRKKVGDRRSAIPPKPPKSSTLSDPRGAIPLLWNSASKSAANSEEAGNLEDFNAALARMFEKRMFFQPRFQGALEIINEALARDLLENSSRISASDRQRILYSMGGRGAYLQLPKLLLELREAADHPVEEQRRIKNLHRLRRRGIPINRDDLKMRPFTPVEFSGPVTTYDMERGLTEGDIQQRQASVNGWLSLQSRARQLHKQHVLHRHSAASKETVNDDDFEVDDADVLGLSFHAQLSDVEGGEFAKEYSEYIAKLLGGDLFRRKEESGESDDATSTTDSTATGFDE